MSIYQNLILNIIRIRERERERTRRVRLEVRDEPFPERTQTKLPVLLLRPLHRAPRLLRDEHRLLASRARARSDLGRRVEAFVRDGVVPGVRRLVQVAAFREPVLFSKNRVSVRCRKWRGGKTDGPRGAAHRLCAWGRTCARSACS